MDHSKDLVYGVLFPGNPSADDLTSIPRDLLGHLRRTYDVLKTATTWGEVLERAPEPVYAELLAQHQPDFRSSVAGCHARAAAALPA